MVWDPQSSASNLGHCHDTYFDDMRVTRAGSEDYVMALRGNTRDMLGHVDIHAVGGLDGTAPFPDSQTLDHKLFDR